ncbi:MAG: 16S rRNA (guanine(966)-N(2))-methyltransferase RsmD [Legionellales bacterium RIFCSPHIGHO2_12_FULL_42_9]|nr:MAG: 16S rRNA (guanine(966)-N(2))-methyltransferase RsmD [Legionellales bacterium RIFCSPHIGHO2_12_FULL_42_9]
MRQQIRIIGGKLRGKKISFPAIEGLRPTPNRIRETLFNWLMNRVLRARCLDAFAGSGALGFEAFSRGADEVVFIEKSAIAYNHLQQIARDFNAGAASDNESHLQVIHADAAHYLQTHPEPFDIIFVDPPFAKACSLQFIDLIQTSNTLKPGGLLYLEAPNRLTLNPQHWTALKSKCAGSVYYSLYERQRE